jgi:hypothetical protein
MGLKCRCRWHRETRACPQPSGRCGSHETRLRPKIRRWHCHPATDTECSRPASPRIARAARTGLTHTAPEAGNCSGLFAMMNETHGDAVTRESVGCCTEMRPDGTGAGRPLRFSLLPRLRGWAVRLASVCIAQGRLSYVRQRSTRVPFLRTLPGLSRPRDNRALCATKRHPPCHRPPVQSF